MLHNSTTPEPQWLAKYPLLGTKDYHHIVRLGLPVGNTALLYGVDGDSQVRLTARGGQYLAALFEFYELGEVPSELNFEQILQYAKTVSHELNVRNQMQMAAQLAQGELNHEEEMWARSYLRASEPFPG